MADPRFLYLLDKYPQEHAGYAPWPRIGEATDEELRKDLALAHELRDTYGMNTPDGAVCGGVIGGWLAQALRNAPCSPPASVSALAQAVPKQAGSILGVELEVCGDLCDLPEAHVLVFGKRVPLARGLRSSLGPNSTAPTVLPRYAGGAYRSIHVVESVWVVLLRFEVLAALALG